MSLDFSKNPLIDKINKIIEFVKNNKKVVSYYLLGAFGVSFILGGYFLYRLGLEKRAHKDFLIALKTFNAKVVNTLTDKDLDPDVYSSENDKWLAVNKIFKNYYEKNKSAGIAPMFLAYRVEALINLGKLADAIGIQRSLVKLLPKKSGLKPLNDIKLSLMLIDTNINEQLKEGLSILKKIANELGNIAQDEALYRLGEYYWNMHVFKEAANYWNQLKIKFGKNSKNPSPWAEKAYSRLKTITV